MARPCKITDDEIEEALRISHGLMASAAKVLTKAGHKITRQGVEFRVAGSKRLQEVARQEIETLTDFAESKLYELIQAGDKTSIIFYLKCKGKSRGYIERSELTGADGSALMPNGKLDPAKVEITLRSVSADGVKAVKNGGKP